MKTGPDLISRLEEQLIKPNKKGNLPISFLFGACSKSLVIVKVIHSFQTNYLLAPQVFNTADTAKKPQIPHLKLFTFCREADSKQKELKRIYWVMYTQPNTLCWIAISAAGKSEEEKVRLKLQQ